MPAQQIRCLLYKFAFFAAIVTIAPTLHAQSTGAKLPASNFSALPSALTPAASAVPASYSPQLSTIRIPQENAIKSGQNAGVESLPSRRKWLALSVVSSSAAEFDAYSTRRSIAAGNVEADPTMRPFAGSPAIYAAIQASPLVLDYAALRMQHSRLEFIRRMWWIPQTGGTAMSLFAGAHNFSISSR